MIADRERSKMQMKDLQQQLSEMHDELDQSKKAEMINAEKEVLLKVRFRSANSTQAAQPDKTIEHVSWSQDMAQLRADFQDMLLVKEEREDLLQQQEKELSDLKGAIKDEVETHDKYIAALKEEYELELQHLLRDLEKTREVSSKPFFIVLSSHCLHLSFELRATVCWAEKKWRRWKRAVQPRRRCRS